MHRKKTLLFNIDGTLTYPRKAIQSDMSKIIRKLRDTYYIGVVGGSDLSKQIEQLGPTDLKDFDYNFAENGLIAYKNGKEIHKKSFKDFLGEKKLQKLINFCLKYISELDIPVKRGTFIEFRSGMLNISPIGRNCSQEERNEFYLYDIRYKVRENFVKVLEEHFEEMGLKFSIGGQISFDVFPKGWDKTYCLQHVVSDNFKEIHFFGDKTNPGENDYEIYVSDKTIGYKVAGPEETISILKENFM